MHSPVGRRAISGNNRSDDPPSLRTLSLGTLYTSAASLLNGYSVGAGGSEVRSRVSETPIAPEFSSLQDAERLASTEMSPLGSQLQAVKEQLKAEILKFAQQINTWQELLDWVLVEGDSSFPYLSLYLNQLRRNLLQAHRAQICFAVEYDDLVRLRGGLKQSNNFDLGEVYHALKALRETTANLYSRLEIESWVSEEQRTIRQIPFELLQHQYLAELNRLTRQGQDRLQWRKTKDELNMLYARVCESKSNDPVDQARYDLLMEIFRAYKAIDSRLLNQMHV